MLTTVPSSLSSLEDREQEEGNREQEKRTLAFLFSLPIPYSLFPIPWSSLFPIPFFPRTTVERAARWKIENGEGIAAASYLFPVPCSLFPRFPSCRSTGRCPRAI